MIFKTWVVKINRGLLRDNNGHPVFFKTLKSAQEVAAKWGGHAEKVSVRISEL